MGTGWLCEGSRERPVTEPPHPPTPALGTHRKPHPEIRDWRTTGLVVKFRTAVPLQDLGESLTLSSPIKWG